VLRANSACLGKSGLSPADLAVALMCACSSVPYSRCGHVPVDVELSEACALGAPHHRRIGVIAMPSMEYAERAAKHSENDRAASGHEVVPQSKGKQQRSTTKWETVCHKVGLSIPQSGIFQRKDSLTRSYFFTIGLYPSAISLAFMASASFMLVKGPTWT
jgi:hypothetical protein